MGFLTVAFASDSFFFYASLRSFGILNSIPLSQQCPANGRNPAPRNTVYVSSFFCGSKFSADYRWTRHVFIYLCYALIALLLSLPGGQFASGQAPDVMRSSQLELPTGPLAAKNPKPLQAFDQPHIFPLPI
jgi:hypothetical protein